MRSTTPALLAAALFALAVVPYPTPAAQPPGDKPAGRTDTIPLDPNQPIGADPVPGLVEALRDANADVRRSAAFSLKYYPQADTAVIPLIEAFSDEDDIVRSNAIDAVVLMRPRNSVPFLTKALRDDKPVVRRSAAIAVGRINRYTDEAVPTLVFLLRDPDPDVRDSAAEAIRRIFKSLREY